MLEVSREQALAYRIAEQGLHRSVADPYDLPLLDLGLQDSMRDTALLSLAARMPDPVAPESLVDDQRLALVWSHRGAPHFHRRADLPELVSALVPIDEPDALARMLWQKKDIQAAGVSPVDILFTTARAIRKVVTKPMTKGVVSAEITKLLPPAFSRWCRPCNATHVHEQLMRIASLHGGARLEAGRVRRRSRLWRIAGGCPRVRCPRRFHGCWNGICASTDPRRRVTRPVSLAPRRLAFAILGLPPSPRSKWTIGGLSSRMIVWPRWRTRRRPPEYACFRRSIRTRRAATKPYSFRTRRERKRCGKSSAALARY